MQQITDVKIQQQILCYGLKHFSQVCEKNHLRFFICNGTLLGAVKYQGFIPWDDDVDILMPREDYDKLMTLSDIDTEDFCLLSRERDAKWKIPFAKLSHKHTIQKETTADFGCENGISVDIFPIDFWQGRKSHATMQAVYCGLLRRFMSASLEEKFFSPRTGLKRWILYCIWFFSRLCGTDFFVRLVDTQRKKGMKHPGNYCGCLVWAAYGAAEVIECDQFDDQSQITFCGETYPTIRNPDRYLRNLYGDYQKELPQERQHSNHALKVWWKNK